MGIINKMRRQKAIYWPSTGPGDFGKPGHGPLVELVLRPNGDNYRVRWEDKVEEFLDEDGTVQCSNAVVYLPLLPDETEVVVGGVLWLGNRGDLTSETVPMNNPGAFEVRRFDRLPNLKATETLRTAYL